MRATTQEHVAASLNLHMCSKLTDLVVGKVHGKVDSELVDQPWKHTVYSG